MALLQLQSVSKSYGALQVIQDVSFSVEEGQTLGILGPMGHGCGELQMAARVLII